MKNTEPTNYQTAWIENIQEIERTSWNNLAYPLKMPFLEWQWLYLIESSGSASPATGWNPMHLTVWSKSENKLVAAVPLYIKTNNSGEFSYDHIWAEIANHFSISYYPKLIGMVPFTPVAGYQFLIAENENEEKLTRIIVNEIDLLCSRLGFSNCCFNFVDPNWALKMKCFGFQIWEHQGLIWKNFGFRTEDDYLAQFKSNQRKNIKKEWRALEEQGIFIKEYRGKDISSNLLNQMYRFYSITNEKYGPWGCKYLTKEFFHGLYNYRDRLLIFAAYTEGGIDFPLGMSMLITKGDQLYGRYWGGQKDIKFLHFNLCYYRPINWAIHNGIRCFDPGVGGIHKLRRGFLVTPNYSAHRFYDPTLQSIFARCVKQINNMEEKQIAKINKELPFSKGDFKKEIY